MQTENISSYQRHAVQQSGNATNNNNHGLPLESAMQHGAGSQLPKCFPPPTQTFIVDETKNYMEGILPDDDDSDVELKDSDKIHGSASPTSDLLGPPRAKKTRGRVKIKMEFIQNKLRRYTTFSKRKTGIMKKAYELSTLTGTQVMLLVASETGHVYTFATRKLQPMITSESGKALIQTCLNSPDPAPQQHQQVTHIQAAAAPVQAIQPRVSSPPTQVSLPSDQRMSQHGYEETDLQYSNAEEELKGNQQQAPGGPSSIQYVVSGQSFPMTTLIPAQTQAQPTKQTHSAPVTYSVQPVAGGSITTIFTPAGLQANPNPSIQIQTPQPISSTNSPQILSGQLQLHRIHPQNIILTGNQTGQLHDNHILLNPPGGASANHPQGIPLVIAENPQAIHQQQQSSANNAGAQANTGHPGQDGLITIVNAADTPNVDNPSALRVIYNAHTGGVIYAPQSGTHANVLQNSSQQPQPHIRQSDVLSLQHTPVIQTSAGAQYQHAPSVIERHLVGETIIVRHSGQENNK